MSHRIIVNIVDMPSEIVVVANRVLPISPLPEGKLPVAMTRNRNSGLHDSFGKSAFDQAPSVRIVSVSFRQCHDNVKVVGQHYDRIDCEGVREPDFPYRCAQGFDVLNQHPRGSIHQRQREEERPSRNEISTVMHHAAMLARIERSEIRATGHCHELWPSRYKNTIEGRLVTERWRIL